MLCELLKLTAWSCKGRAQSWVDGRAGTPSLRLRSKPQDLVAAPLTAICGLGHTVGYHTSNIPVGVASPAYLLLFCAHGWGVWMLQTSSIGTGSYPES